MKVVTYDFSFRIEGKGIVRYRDLAIVLTMLFCDLRSQEVIKIRIEDIDFQQRLICVRGKGKRERLVPIPLQLLQVEKYLHIERPESEHPELFLVMQGENYAYPISREGLRSFFRYRRKKLGIDQARAHQFRHTFASDLARAGVPISIIQKLLGHSDIKTCEIYINLFMEDIKSEYDKAMKRIEERYAALQK